MRVALGALAVIIACGGTENAPPKPASLAGAASASVPVAPVVESPSAALTRELTACTAPKDAANTVLDMAKSGAKLEPPLALALWTCFASYRPSKTNSLLTTIALHDAILAVKDPSYAGKAIAIVEAPVEPSSTRVNDQIEFWKTTAIQVLKELHPPDAAKALVSVLVTQGELGIATLAQSALLRMPRAAVPVLVSALDGSDADFADRERQWDADKGWVAIVVSVLGATATNAARDAIVAYLPRIDTPSNLAAAAQSLVWFPSTPALVAQFKSVYARLPPIAMQADADTGTERAQALGVVGELFDPALGSWALAEAANAKGTNELAARIGAIQGAIKSMRRTDEPAIERAIASLDRLPMAPAEKKMILGDVRTVFKLASETTGKCATNASCYVKILEEPIPQTSNANWRAIKAAYAAAQFGNDQTRKDLIAHLANVKNPGARLAMAVAILHLAPSGDASDADAMDAIVADDNARHDADAIRSDDALVKVANMLRARAQ